MKTILRPSTGHHGCDRIRDWIGSDERSPMRGSICVSLLLVACSGTAFTRGEGGDEVGINVASSGAGGARAQNLNLEAVGGASGGGGSAPTGGVASGGGGTGTAGTYGGAGPTGGAGGAAPACFFDEECPDDGVACTDNYCVLGECWSDINCVLGTTCDMSSGQCIGAAPGCAPAQVYFSGTCYGYIAEDQVTWMDAQLTCQALGADWDLVRIDSQAENDVVFALMAAGGGSVWIGGDDRTTESRWEWPDGTWFWQGDDRGIPQVPWTNWASGEPDDGGIIYSHDCIAMWSDGLWHDVECQATLGSSAVCEGPAQ